MSDLPDASLDELDERIRSRPEQATEEVSELLSRVGGSGRDSRLAAMLIDSLASDVPNSLTDDTENISSQLYHASDIGVRARLTSALTDIVAEYPEKGSEITKGLTEATRVRKEQFQENDPTDEIRNVCDALEGWIELAQQEYQVPSEVVENAVEVTALQMPEHSSQRLNS